MNQKTDIALIGNKVREYLLFKYLSRELWVRYKLTSKLFAAYYYPFSGYNSSILISHRINSENYWLMQTSRLLANNRIRFVNLDREQLASDWIVKKRLPKDDFAKYAVYHLAWYDFNKHLYMQAGVPEERIFVVGNFNDYILSDLLEKKNEIRDQLSRKFKLNKDVPWYFFPMSTDAFALPRFITAYKYGDRALPDNVVDELHRFCIKYLKEFLTFVEKLAKIIDSIIIIRPHPEVLEDDYLEFYQQHGLTKPANVYVIKYESAHKWIVASDVIGTTNSTLVYNALQIGKPAFWFRGRDNLHPNLQAQWMGEVVSVKDFEDFEAKLSKITAAAKTKQQQKVPNTIELMANALWEIFQKEPNNPPMNWKYKIKAVKTVGEMAARMLVRRTVAALNLKHIPRVNHIVRWAEDKYFKPIVFPDKL